jgi:hypothetical protein
VPSKRTKHLHRLYDYRLQLKRREAGIVQSVQRLATGWTAEGSEFESRQGKDFSPLLVVQTGYGAHPAGTKSLEDHDKRLFLFN